MAFNTIIRRPGPLDPDDLVREINENFAKCAEVTLATLADGELLVYSSSSSAWINVPFSDLSVDLNDLGNVDTTGLADGSFLLYDASSSTWLDATPTEILTLLDIQLDDIGDVAVTGAADGSLLIYEASSNSWLDATVSAVLATGSLDDLSDVNVPSPNDGDTLVWNASTSSWIAGAGSTVAALNDLTDVDTTGVTDQQVIVYNASSGSWVVADQSGSGGGIDTVITDPKSGDLLVYDEPTGAWINTTGQTSFVERTYTDSFTMSAVSSGTWDIPDNCIRFHMTAPDITVGGTVSNPGIYLNKASDGLSDSFYVAGIQGVSGGASVSQTIGLSGSYGIVAYNGSGTMGFEALVYFPRSTTIKTSGTSHVNCAANDIFRTVTVVAQNAEDHDQIEIKNATSFTGTAYITYTVLEPVLVSTSTSNELRPAIGTWDLSVDTLDSGNEVVIDVSDYSSVKLGLWGGTSGVSSDILVQVSSDGGSTWRTVSGEYEQMLGNESNVGSGQAVTGLLLCVGGGGTTEIHGHLDINGLNSSNNYVYSRGQSSSSNTVVYSHAGATRQKESINTIRITKTDAMTAGELTVWGTPRNLVADASVSTAFTTYVYTATASQTAFVGADDNSNTLRFDASDYIEVYLNGTKLIPTTDYNTTDAPQTVTLTVGASLNDELQVKVVRRGTYVADGYSSNTRVKIAEQSTTSGSRFDFDVSGYSEVYFVFDSLSLDNASRPRLSVSTDGGTTLNTTTTQMFQSSASSSVSTSSELRIGGSNVTTDHYGTVEISGLDLQGFKYVDAVTASDDGIVSDRSGWFQEAGVVNTIVLEATTGAFDGGTVYVYGVPSKLVASSSIAASFDNYVYTATVSQTVFTGADDNTNTLTFSSEDFVEVHLNGVKLIPITDFNTSVSNTVTLTVGASVSDKLEVKVVKRREIETSVTSYVVYDHPLSTINESSNISSVTDSATGRAQVSFTNNINSATYPLNGIAGFVDADALRNISFEGSVKVKAADGYGVRVSIPNSAALNDSDWSVTTLGELA